jgi:hypothetical protein
MIMNSKQMIRNTVFVALSALAGCSSVNGMMHGSSKDAADIALRSSSDIPAAQGRLVVKGSDGPNQVVDVTVAHMAQPSKVRSNATAYVVWLDPAGTQPPINMGVLSVDKDLKGSLEFKTPFQQFDVFVTAEPGATAQAPSDKKLMTASVDLPGHAIR